MAQFNDLSQTPTSSIKTSCEKSFSLLSQNSIYLLMYGVHQTTRPFSEHVYNLWRRVLSKSDKHYLLCLNFLVLTVLAVIVGLNNGSFFNQFLKIMTSGRK